jgi:hypothetical protein
MRLRTLPLTLLACLVLAAPTASWACGQTTHVWVTLAALDELPAGELRDLLTDPAVRDAIVNGTMFPDGGYPIGDAYAELAHWEPFQQRYLAWIRDEYGPDFDTPEARSHVAFLMGLGSHGMSDENFDSLFYERSRAHDPGHDEQVTGLDTASDVFFAAAVGGVLQQIYRDAHDYEVTVGRLQEGHGYLFTALAYVEWARDVDERVQTMTAEFPWAQRWMTDPDVPGAPPRQAGVVAAYWGELWERLHDRLAWENPVVAWEPPHSTEGEPTLAGTPEAAVQITFGRGLLAETLDRVRIVDPDGAVVPMQIRHFYGDKSHAVVLRPEQDWSPGVEYRLQLAPGLRNLDGAETKVAWERAFYAVSPEPVPEPSPVDCGGGAAWLLLLPLGTRRGRR